MDHLVNLGISAISGRHGCPSLVFMLKRCSVHTAEEDAKVSEWVSRGFAPILSRKGSPKNHRKKNIPSTGLVYLPTLSYRTLVFCRVHVLTRGFTSKPEVCKNQEKHDPPILLKIVLSVQLFRSTLWTHLNLSMFGPKPGIWGAQIKQPNVLIGSSLQQLSFCSLYLLPRLRLNNESCFDPMAIATL